MRIGAVFGARDEILSQLDKLSDFNNALFVSAFLNYVKTSNKKLHSYISTVYVQQGGGWSIDFFQTLGLTLKGIERIFELRDVPIPVLSTSQTFQTFVHRVSYGEKAVAVVESSLFDTDDLESHSRHVFAILYEKRLTQDVLHVYNSEGSIGVGVSRYFRDNLTVLLPEQLRQHYGDGSSTCHVYAIRDALALQSQELFLGEYQKGFQRFRLDDAFMHEAMPYKKALFRELILDTAPLHLLEEEILVRSKI